MPAKIETALDKILKAKATARNAYAVCDVLTVQLCDITLNLRHLAPFIEEEPDYQKLIDRIERILELKNMMELGDLSLRIERLMGRAYDKLNS